jgi:hypothetical protein
MLSDVVYFYFIRVQAAQILFSIVRDQEHSLQVLDISGENIPACFVLSRPTRGL